MPIPMWPKMEHSVGREDAVSSNGREQSSPLRLAPVSAGRPLLHFLSIGTRCVCASYTIPLIRMRGDTPCYL